MVRSLRAYPVPKRLGHLALTLRPSTYRIDVDRTGRGVTVAPLVSVVMPVLNGADTVGAAVESVLGQTLTDIELIVIDDGSTDDTAAVLAGIHDQRLRISTHPECRGLTASLRSGVELATSGLVARMDADDIAYPDRLALEYGVFRASPQVGLVATAYEVVDDDGAGLHYVGVPPDHASVALWLLFGCCLAHPTVMFRRDVYRLVGGYRDDDSRPTTTACGCAWSTSRRSRPCRRRSSGTADRAPASPPCMRTECAMARSSSPPAPSSAPPPSARRRASSRA